MEVCDSCLCLQIVRFGPNPPGKEPGPGSPTREFFQSESVLNRPVSDTPHLRLHSQTWRVLLKPSLHPSTYPDSHLVSLHTITCPFLFMSSTWCASLCAGMVDWQAGPCRHFFWQGLLPMPLGFLVGGSPHSTTALPSGIPPPIQILRLYKQWASHLGSLTQTEFPQQRG